MFDTHCHLTHPLLIDEVDAVVARARAAGLVACVTIGTGVADARRCLELAARFDRFLFCSAGIDPFTAHEAGERFDEELVVLEELLLSRGFRALGEIGLDYHYDLDPRVVQADRFERQLDLAVALDLPVVVHVREAHEDVTAILAHHLRARGVIHSFTAGPAEAARYLELGWHLAFNGVVTFGDAAEVREAAKMVPADRLLVETDSPYLAPVPLRGRRCEPAYLALTLKCLSEVRGEPSETLAARTTRNAASLFGISVHAPGAQSSPPAP